MSVVVPQAIGISLRNSPFTKWGLDFMDCNPASARGNHPIIMVVDYFMKWAEAMPTVKSDGEIATHFIFNQSLSLTMVGTFKIG